MADWKTDFKKAMIKALIVGGSPVSDKASFYGWQDYTGGHYGKDHPKRLLVERVGVDFDKTTYRESWWDEFMGTFYEGDTRVYGVDLDLVLQNGQRLHWRYSGKLGELITAVLEADE